MFYSSGLGKCSRAVHVLCEEIKVLGKQQTQRLFTALPQFRREEFHLNFFISHSQRMQERYIMLLQTKSI